MRIRRATIDDVNAVMQLVRRVVPLMRESGNFQWDDEYPNALGFTSDVENGLLWVAEIGEAIAGVAAITTDQYPEYVQVGWEINERAIVVHRLAVDPDFRGRGVAAALMSQAEIVGRERGIRVMRVDTNTQTRRPGSSSQNSAMSVPARSISDFVPVSGSCAMRNGRFLSETPGHSTGGAGRRGRNLCG